MPVRPRFDPKRALIAARTFTFGGRAYAPGQPFPHPDDAEAIPDRLRARQYEARAVDFAPEADAEPDLVTMSGPQGGRYTIEAPWLERPLSIRGKVNAEKALAEMREEGPPLGWIEGGTEVEIEESGGGWYAISAPWLDEAENVQGREAAEKRQREIHDAGRPVVPENAIEADAAGGDSGDAPEQNAAKAQSDASEVRPDAPPEGDDGAVGDLGGDAGDAKDPPAAA